MNWNETKHLPMKIKEREKQQQQQQIGRGTMNENAIINFYS